MGSMNPIDLKSSNLYCMQHILKDPSHATSCLQAPFKNDQSEQKNKIKRLQRGVKREASEIIHLMLWVDCLTFVDMNSVILL